MRPIGLHIRITETIMQAAEYARHLDIPIFQCFLVNQTNRQPLHINSSTAEQFKIESHHRTLYIHGSYWINLVQLKKSGVTILKNEIQQTKLLGSKHLILHPGAPFPTISHSQGIDILAQIINSIMAHEKEIVLVLENTAHAHQAIGSNLTDFYHLKQKLDWPERLYFCIDTAHAHAYGYDISDPNKQNDFINLIDETIGIDAIELLHLNDAAHPCGSRIDKHVLLGHGTIGLEALQLFAMNPRLSSIPLILELPNLPSEQDHAMLQIVRSWHTSTPVI